MAYAYDCEKKLVDKGLPAMIENANSSELRSALQRHLEETHGHVTRLGRVFLLMGVQPRTESNAVLGELMSAAKDSISHVESSPLRDAALIVNGNFVEHYEIALYASLAAIAKNLGLPDAAQVLNETLIEEKAADAKLSEIGETLLTGKRQAASS